MSLKCSYCGSLDTQVLADRRQCLYCGHYTFEDGTKAEPGVVWTSEPPVQSENFADATKAAKPAPKKKRK